MKLLFVLCLYVKPYVLTPISWLEMKMSTIRSRFSELNFSDIWSHHSCSAALHMFASLWSLHTKKKPWYCKCTVWTLYLPSLINTIMWKSLNLHFFTSVEFHLQWQRWKHFTCKAFTFVEGLAIFPPSVSPLTCRRQITHIQLCLTKRTYTGCTGMAVFEERDTITVA